MCDCCGAHIVHGLAHVEIFCRDIEASKSFYMETLGFHLDYETVLDSPDGPIKLAYVKSGDFILALAQFPKGPPEPQMGPVNHFALQTSDIDTVFGHLKQDGAPVESDQVTHLPLKNGVKFFNLRGPDGERVELVESL